jgi:hypothetical protein
MFHWHICDKYWPNSIKQLVCLHGLCLNLKLLFGFWETQSLSTSLESICYRICSTILPTIESTDKGLQSLLTVEIASTLGFHIPSHSLGRLCNLAFHFGVTYTLPLSGRYGDDDFHCRSISYKCLQSSTAFGILKILRLSNCIFIINL